MAAFYERSESFCPPVSERRALGSHFGVRTKRLRGYLLNNGKFQLYKSAFDLTIYIEECFRNFKRADKYTIGTELRKMVNDLLLKISTFNDLKREEKAGFCSKLLKDIDKLQIKMNLCQELSVFKGYKSWYHAAEMLFDINVQCEKLKKHFEGNRQNHGGNALS